MSIIWWMKSTIAAIPNKIEFWTGLNRKIENKTNGRNDSKESVEGFTYVKQSSSLSAILSKRIS